MSLFFSSIIFKTQPSFTLIIVKVSRTIKMKQIGLFIKRFFFYKSKQQAVAVKSPWIEHHSTACFLRSTVAAVENVSCTRQTSEGVILKIDSKEWSHLRLTQCLRQNTNGFHDSLICCTVENDMYAGVDADCHFKGDHFFSWRLFWWGVNHVCLCVSVCRRWRISCPVLLLWLKQRRKTDRLVESWSVFFSFLLQ